MGTKKKLITGNPERMLSPRGRTVAPFDDEENLMEFEVEVTNLGRNAKWDRDTDKSTPTGQYNIGLADDAEKVDISITVDSVPDVKIGDKFKVIVQPV